MDLKDLLQLLLGGGVLVGMLRFFWEFSSKEREKHCSARSHLENAEETYQLALRVERARLPLYRPGFTDAFSEDPNELRDQVKELLKKAVEIGPDRKTEAGIYFLRAQLSYDIKNFEKCVEYTTKALKSNRKMVKVYELRGRAYRSLGKHTLAIWDFKKVVKEDPYDEETQRWLQLLQKEDVTTVTGLDKLLRTMFRGGRWMNMISI